MSQDNYGKSGLIPPASQRPIITYQREILGVISLAGYLFLLLSCLSFSPTDKSFFYITSAGTSVTNWCGVVGAEFAAFLFYIWGSVTYVLLMLLLLPLAMTLGLVSMRDSLARLSSLLVGMIISVPFFKEYGITHGAILPGGLLGFYAQRSLYTLCGQAGAKIIITMGMVTAILLITRISLVRCGTWLARLLMMVMRFIFVGVSLFGTLLFKSIHRGWHLFSALCTHVARLFVGEKKEPDTWNQVEQIVAVMEQRAVVHVKNNFTLKKARFAAKAVYAAPHQRTLMGRHRTIMLANSVVLFNISSLIERLHEENKVFVQEEVKAPVLALEGRSKKTSSQEVPQQKFVLPHVTLFHKPAQARGGDAGLLQECNERALKLKEKLERFGIKGEVTAVCPGPVITLFEYQPQIDSKISKIIALEDDLALALTALSIRIVAPIPGRSVVGFEISNKVKKDVSLADVIQSESFKLFKGALPLVLGVDSTGQPVIEDLMKAPHLLVAGSTGSGKSVGLNGMLVSLLYRLTPDELKLILIDPKRLEFAPYADIPHLIFPIITNPRQAAPILQWVVSQMEERYDMMARAGVRNISDYHQFYLKQKEKVTSGDEQPLFEPMPFMVVMIDELADLMMVAGKEVEVHIARIAQMARAAGIHLIVATQRPSVDVLTGIIKVNFPSRIAYRVSSKIDSRTILDASGAEKLLGRGDMLYLHSGSSELMRVHGAYVSDQEINMLATYLRLQRKVTYLDIHDVVKHQKQDGYEAVDDDLYTQVCELIKTKDEISISMLQRHFRIGFNRSARLIEKLEMDGLVAPAQGSKPRKILHS